VKFTDLIIKDAHQRGLRHCFGIPGGGIPLAIMEAGRQKGVNFVLVNYESSAAIAAGAYGQMLGTAGLCMSIKGPGAANMVGGIGTAYWERFPLIALNDDLPASLRGKTLVQACDQVGMFEPFVKYSQHITSENAADAISRATGLAISARPGPVYLGLPPDILNAEINDSVEPFDIKEPPFPDLEALKKARKLLAKSRRPVVIAGTDALRAGAGDVIRTLVEHCQAAVLVNIKARGIIPDNHPRLGGVLQGLFLPETPETDYLNQADLIIFVGVDPVETNKPWDSDIPKIELVQNIELDCCCPDAEVRINGSLKDSMQALIGAGGRGFSEEEINNIRENILKRGQPDDRDPFPAHEVVRITRQVLPENGILVLETGIFMLVTEYCWPVLRPGTYFTTGGSRTMGMTIPAILGMKLACPDIPMVGYCGNGSFLMRIMELETLARTGLSVPIVVFNDQCLGTISSRQKSAGLPEYGLKLHPIDIPKIARGFGLNGVEVNNASDYESELKKAMAQDRTTVISVLMDHMCYRDLYPRLVGRLT